MRSAVAEVNTTGRLCRFSAVAVIFGSTGRTFANGCEVEPTSEQHRRKRRPESLGKNEPDSLQFPLQSAQRAQVKSALSVLKCWRRGWDSNPRMEVLQTSP